MPDRLEKYPIDEQLLNEGWQQMSTLLDNAMPVEKRWRSLLSFSWLNMGIAALLLVSGLYGLNYTPNIVTAPKQTAIQQSSADPKTENDKTENDKNITQEIEINQNSISSSLSNTTVAASAKNKKFSLSEEKTAQSIDSERFTENIRVKNIPIQTSFVAIIDDNLALKATKIEENSSPITSYDEANPNTLTIPATRSINAIYLPFRQQAVVSVKTIEAQGMPRPITKIKRPRRNQHGLYGRYNYTGLVENGFTLGYVLQRQIKGLHSFQARLFWEKNTRFTNTVTESFTLPKSTFVKAGTSVSSDKGDTVITQIIYPYSENCDCAKIAKAHNAIATHTLNKNQYVIVSSAHLGIGADYAYRITPRWELMAGMGVSATLTSLSYHFQYGIDRYGTFGAKPENMIVNASPSSFYGDTNFSFDANNTDIANHSRNQRVFNNVDGYMELGANFLVTKHLRLGAAYRYGVIDVTRRDILNKKDYNTYGFIQGAYMF